MLPHLAGRALTFNRFPNGVEQKGFFEKRCAKHRPEWVADRAGPGGSQRDHRVLRDRRAGLTRLGGQHGGAGAPRAHGPGRGPGDPADGRVRSRSRPAGRHPRVCPDGARHPGRPRRGRARGVAEVQRLEGPPAVRPRQHAVHARRRGVVRPGGRAAPREAGPGQRAHLDDEGGPQGQGLRRLEPERPSQDDHRRRTRCGPAPTRRSPRPSPGTRSRRRPTGPPTSASCGRTCSSGSRTMGDVFAPVLSVEQVLPGAR